MIIDYFFTLLLSISFEIIKFYSKFLKKLSTNSVNNIKLLVTVDTPSVPIEYEIKMKYYFYWKSINRYITIKIIYLYYFNFSIYK